MTKLKLCKKYIILTRKCVCKSTIMLFGFSTTTQQDLRYFNLMLTWISLYKYYTIIASGTMVNKYGFSWDRLWLPIRIYRTMLYGVEVIFWLTIFLCFEFIYLKTCHFVFVWDPGEVFFSSLQNGLVQVLQINDQKNIQLHS